ncbi:hypothetical protein Lfu02_80700 [Longispora fulva]|uniref:Alkylhydroperoxidase family enzyme n=1 Tax=Longispora fulva TaxID=619741 RepID=A0A8J7KW76_9ACTN|nr:hypothetical protein [Longispora fulva]MBG6136202.1 alkylhydroperoxidase family enzyme [Longispora fulva]GIG63698.1 hypothetical protein Lfu02_80700 [Longispora fulva]
MEILRSQVLTDTHNTDALKGGEEQQRLSVLPVWRDTPLFTDRERAALELTEAMVWLADIPCPTRFSPARPPSSARSNSPS